MTNVNPILSGGILPGKDEHPIVSKLKKTIGNLSKLARILEIILFLTGISGMRISQCLKERVN